MMSKLTHELILRPEIVAHLEGIDTELPANSAQWRVLAVQSVANCELSQRSIQASDQELKQQIIHDALAALPPQVRMSRARNGSLDDYLASVVEEQLETRLTGAQNA